MPVRQDNRLDLIPIFDQISNIRNDKVNAQHILLWEHQSGVNDKNLIIHTDGGHILSDFTKTAQRDDLHLLHIFSMVSTAAITI